MFEETTPGRWLGGTASQETRGTSETARTSQTDRRSGTESISETSSSSDAENMTSQEEPWMFVMRREMRHAYKLDIHILDKLFPAAPVSDPNYERVRRQWFNAKRGRWKGISATPKTPSRIFTPLTNILNGILSQYGISRAERLFVNTHAPRSKGPKLAPPGIVLSGVGTEFSNSAARLPIVVYNSLISLIEVIFDSKDLKPARNRLAAHMHWMFQGQDNRRFAFGLIMTPEEFTLYMFDHSGAVASAPCNYHLHPDRFCAVVAGLAAKGQHIGFDHTMFKDNANTKICTFQPTREKSRRETQYLVKDRLFYYSSLIGRGTICWRTSRVDDPSSNFVIKDAWVPSSDPPGRESEASLLLHAQSRGITRGICQICHFEEVRLSGDPLDQDTVLGNRKNEDASPKMLKLERVHTRIVMSTFGKPLDLFSSKKELLLAFYDAVLAHRKLYEVAGILHRDISYMNILINPKGIEGDRGILIDLDHSIRVDDTSPYSKKPRIGTYRFRSREVLRGQVPHTYFDDLESFYYVLCWLVCSFERPGLVKKLLPDKLLSWERPLTAERKTGYLLCGFPFEVYNISPYFGTSLPALLGSLHEFFRIRLLKPPTKSEPAKDYEGFTSLIRQAIDDLEKEEKEAPDGVTDPHSQGDSPSPSRTDEFKIHSRSKGGERLTYGRPRRTTANYGSLSYGV